MQDNEISLPLDNAFLREPQISVTPNIVDQEEYSVADIHCTASGTPTPRIQWVKLEGDISPDATIRGGHLRFNSLRKSDEGTYSCFAENEAGNSDQTVIVVVRGGRQQPINEEVSVSPPQLVSEPGEEITIRCIASPRGRVSWSKAGAVELPRNAFVSGDDLTIRYSTADDAGRYICTVQFPSGVTRSASTDVTITIRSNEQPPTIIPLERKYSVVQGGDFELTCESSGTPYPTITWSIVRKNLFYYRLFA